MGAISGSGNLVFKEAGAFDCFNNDDRGYIIAVNNPSLSGTVTIGGATENGIAGRLTSVRVGGVNAAADITLVAGTAGTLGAAEVVNNGVLTLSHSDAWTFANNVSGSGSLRIGITTLTGSDTQVVTLSGSNSFTGGTTVLNGTLKLGGANALPNGTLKLQAGTLNLNGYSPTVTHLLGAATASTGSITATNSSDTLTVSSSGSFHVAENLSVANTLQLLGGTLDASGGSLVSYISYGGSSTGVLTVNGGTAKIKHLDLTGSASGNGTLNLTSGTLDIGAGGITNTGVGTAAVNLQGGTLGALASWSSALNMTATNTTTVDTTGGNIDLSGTLSGTGGITKSGAGTLTLSNTNTYGGITAVSNGVLLVNGSLTGAGAVSVASGATLGGTGAIAGAVTVDGTLAPGASVESLAIGGDLTFHAGSSLTYEMDSSAISSLAGDLLVVSGNLNLTGPVGLTLKDLADPKVAFAQNTTLSLINYAGTWNHGYFTYSNNELLDNEVFTAGLNTWKISYNASSGGLNFATEATQAHFVNLTAVPEPGSLFALGCLIGSGALLRTRRRIA